MVATHPHHLSTALALRLVKASWKSLRNRAFDRNRFRWFGCHAHDRRARGVPDRAVIRGQPRSLTGTPQRR